MVLTKNPKILKMKQITHNNWNLPFNRTSGKSDFSDALQNNIPLDQLNPALSSLTGDALYWAQKSLEQDLEDYDRIDEDIFNRIIWHAVKGYEVPYPVLSENLRTKKK